MTLNTPIKNEFPKYSEYELSIYSKISECKWGDEDDDLKYRCRKCGNDKYYPTTKNPYDKKCSNHECKHIESVTAHTPFHRLRLPIGKAMDILLHLSQECSDYNGWFQDLPMFLKIQLVEGNNREKKFPWRTSSEKLAEKFKLHQRTVYSFIFRFASLLPQIERIDTHGPSDSWFRGVEKKNRHLYSNLYNLLVEAKGPNELIEMSIKGN